MSVDAITSATSARVFHVQGPRQRHVVREPAPPAEAPAPRPHRTGDAMIDNELSRLVDRPGPAIITYSVATARSADAPPPNPEVQRIQRALSYYASVANVRFVEVATGGDLRYDTSHAVVTAPGAEADARVPAALPASAS